MGVAYAVDGACDIHGAFFELLKRIEQGKDLMACPVESQGEKTEGGNGVTSPRICVIRQDMAEVVR